MIATDSRNFDETDTNFCINSARLHLWVVLFDAYGYHPLGHIYGLNLLEVFCDD